jgi:outer membrane protein assembly factor BamB
MPLRVNPSLLRLWLVLALALAPAAAFAVATAPHGKGQFTAKEVAQGYRDAVVIAKPKAALLPTVAALERGEGLQILGAFERFGSIRVLGLAQGDTVQAAIARLKATGRYEYVEPDFIRHGVGVVPDDPGFVNQWALHNTGVNGGVAGADINAQAGWGSVSSAPGIIVGIVDSGALTTHQDLAANMWINSTPGTKASYASINDSTGAAETLSETDSLNGLNAVNKSGLPTDLLGHGTHVSGIVGAVGNNGVGVSGVAWKVQLMELEFIDSSDNGATSAELVCLEYAIQHGVSVINASFGSQGFSQAEMDAIYEAGQSGIIFVCAAGNAAENNDISDFFPADYPLDNIIAVGASDNRDLPVYFSNYGSGAVEIFAPGEDIYSTYNGSISDYAYLSGTSMAAPFVTGTVALLRSQFPKDTYRETINRVLNSADTNPGLAGKCQTGGRVDLAKALNGTALSSPPNALFESRTPLVGLDPYTRTNNVDSPAALESGTPQIAGMQGGHSLWWQWTAPENATVEIDTSGTNGGQFHGGSTYPTLLGVYTGTSLSSLTTIAGSANYSGGTDTLEGSGTQEPYSRVSFHTAAGVTYQINVQGQGTQSGQTILAINTTPDNVAISSPVALTGPSDTLLDANPNATGSQPRILGNPGGHTLWYTWTPPFSGTAQVAAYSYDFVPEAAVYTGTSISNLTELSAAQGSNAVGTSTTASQCLCTFVAQAGTAYLIQVDGETSSDVGEFTLSVADSQWQALTQDAVTCSPAVGPDGTVYVGSNDNSFYAFSPGGTLKWSHAAGALFDTSSAAIGADGTVYAGCTDGNVYAFAPSGTLKWTYTVPTPTDTSLDNGLDSSPALSPDGTTLYIHADDGHLYALTASSGSVKWTAAVSGFSYAAPTVAPDGTVYLGTDGGLLYAFNPDGSTQWTFTAPVAGEEIYSAAAIDGSGNLYFNSLSGNVYSIDRSANLRWTYSSGDGLTSAPALANGAVYFGGYDGNLYSLSEETGALNWKVALGAQVRASAPAVDSNGVVYIGSYDHKVYAVNSAGSLVRTYASGDVIRSSPVISGSMLYFGSEDHKVYAFNIGAGPAVSEWPMYQFNASRVGTPSSSTLEITSPPASVTVGTGSPFTLSVGALGPATLAYQWTLNGSPIAGAVGAAYTVASATTADAGSYTVTVTSGSTSVTSAAATVTVDLGPASRLENISTRAQVATGGNIAIAGIHIEAPAGQSKQVLIRGIGPGLAGSPFNLSGTLNAPTIAVYDTSGAVIVSNTGWGNSPVSGNSSVSATFAQASAAQMAAVGAFKLGTGSADSALVVSLPAGGYTVELSGVNSTTGLGLVEVYETSTSDPAVMTDISTRAQVASTSSLLIAGFYVGGPSPATVLVRGVGPALAAAPFNLAGALAQPVVGVYDSSSVLIASNSGWGNAPVAGTSPVNATYRTATAPDMSAAGAFPLTTGSLDSALVLTLPPGAYTAEISGGGGSSGVALAEVYQIVP